VISDAIQLIYASRRFAKNRHEFHETEFANFVAAFVLLNPHPPGVFKVCRSWRLS
jgi:hypothetical protein